VNWRFAEPPHARYAIAVLRRPEGTAGYVVYRHTHEPRGRVTHVVDFFAMPGDDRAHKIRCHAMHAGFRRVLRRSGYFGVRSGLHLSVKLNDPATPSTFYEQTDDWHVTLGDGPVDL
jgi:hypothetical protein